MKRHINLKGCGDSQSLNFSLNTKLSFLFFFLILFQLKAGLGYSQNTKIDLNLINVSIQEVIEAIESKTEFKFFYSQDELDMNQKTSIVSKGYNIERVLRKLFPRESGIVYRVIEKQIVLKSRSISNAQLEFDPTTSISNVQQVVTGQVIDSDGQVLPGANVIEKGTLNGTQTDFDGNFSISVGSDAVLVVSYIGFLAKEVPVDGQGNIVVQLDEDTSQLDEVVVVGYGSKKKVNLTGAVSTVTSETIANRPITSAATALQGTTSGVFVNQNSGQPGRDNVLIRIRGVGTLNNANPLVLIDGIEAPLNNINPSDIESISVLKDAASAAIYGSRAANGVVLVTTKRGATGETTTFNYDSYYGISTAVRLPNMITNSVQFAELWNEGLTNFGQAPAFSDEQIENFRNSGINTDWIDLLFNSAPIQQHDFGIAGGNEKTNFRLSFGYLDQEGVIDNSDFKRFNTRLNLDTKVGKKLKIGTGLSVIRGKRTSQIDDFGNLSSPVTLAIQAHPTYPAFDSEGRFAIGDPDYNNATRGNPLARNAANEFENVSTDFLGNAYVEYRPIEGLVLKGTLAANFQMDHNSTFNKSVSTFNWITGEEQVINDPRSASKWNEQELITTMFLTATYDKSIGDSDFSILAGYSQEESDSERFNAARNGHLSNSVRVLDAGLSSTATNGGVASTWGLRSYFGRLNYTYKDRYLFEANVRVDGTSRFLNDKWGTFPSFSAGWILSNESFLKGSETINFLKLRGSWGQLGNQNTVDRDFAFARTLSLSQAYNFGGSVVPGVAQTSLGNPDLKWETTTTSNIGLNLGIFNSLTIEFDYFIRDTEDILLDLNIPALSGFTTQIQNAAKVQNKGWELVVNYNLGLGEDANLTFGGNLTHVKNEVTELDPRIPDGEVDRNVRDRTVIQQGSPIDSYFGLEAIGIFRSQEEFDAAPDHLGLNPNFGVGDLRFRDVNNDGVINADDRVIIGQQNPTWTYGFNIGFNYKGFDLAAIFQGVADVNGYAGEGLASPFFNNSNSDTRWLDRWTPDNPDASFPRVYISDGPSISALNSFFVTNRAYFRFKNLQIGYSMPRQLLEKSFLDKVRIYANGTNLFTITDFPAFDPERPANADRGGQGFPNLRIISLGLNLAF